MQREVSKHFFSDHPVPGMLICGKIVWGDLSIPVINPATEQVIASAPRATRADLDEAVSGAKNAYVTWRKTKIDERRKRLFALADIMEKETQSLATALCLEQGKPFLGSATEEVVFAINWLRKAAELELTSGLIGDTGDQLAKIDHVPLGVAGLILPWNFPVALAIWKLVPALVTGNCIILKPSPYTPVTGLMIGALAQKLFPDGVFNVLTGDDQLGEWMVEHPGIEKISFTGSIPTGRKVMASAGFHLKRTTLELGGNDAGIVLPDVDIEKVVSDLFWGAFGNSGQWCVGIKRLYVHDDIYSELLENLVAFAKNIRMGDGMQAQAQLGPVQNKKQYEKLRDLIADTKKCGYRFALGGSLPEEKKGYWVPVTIVDNPPQKSRIVREEPFGPVLPVIRYHQYHEVVEMANDSQFGLGASIWGKDLDAINYLSDRLEAGTVWVNQVYVHHPRVPFGGWKSSGIGVEHGEQGLSAYTQLRVTMRPKP